MHIILLLLLSVADGFVASRLVGFGVQLRTVHLHAVGGEDELATALVRKLRTAEDTGQYLEIEDSLIFEPGRPPWGCIHFVGGAGLGTVPGAVYSELLQRLADVTGLGCVATPYELSLDHYAASYETRRKLDAALVAAHKTRDWPQANSDSFPIFGLGHSLGAKLLLLQLDNHFYNRIVCCAPNNFGIQDSARLFRSFLLALNGKNENYDDNTLWQNVLDVALSAAQLAGVQVEPDPETTLQFLSRSANSVDYNKTELITFLSFIDDRLDSTNDLYDALGNRRQLKKNVYRLAGGHLECVYAPQFGLGSISALDLVINMIYRALTDPPPGPSLLPVSGAQ